MRVLRRNAPLILFVLAALFAGLPYFLSVARPAWGPSGCSPVGGFALGQVRAPVYSWQVNATNPGQVDLLRDGRQVGAWFHSDGQYYSSLGREWQPDEPPILAPRPPLGKVVQNFGLDLTQLEHRRGVFLHTGAGGEREVTREEAADVLQNGLVDDRNKLQLTLISSDKGRREAFLKEGAGLGDVVVRAVGPDYFGLRDSETGKDLFQVKGDTIYLQQPDGKVLARMADAKAGDVVALAQAIRKPKPYEPDKDPDPRKPKAPEPAKPDASPAMPAWVKDVPAGGWVLLAMAGLAAAAAMGRAAPR